MQKKYTFILDNNTIVKYNRLQKEKNLILRQPIGRKEFFMNDFGKSNSLREALHENFSDNEIRILSSVISYAIRDNEDKIECINIYNNFQSRRVERLAEEIKPLNRFYLLITGQEIDY